MARLASWPKGLSLFWKVYLTLVAAVVLVALAIAIIVRVSASNEFGPWAERGRIFFARSIPLENPGPAVARLADALDADLALRGPDGALLAGDPTLRRGRAFVFTLPDGRLVHARFGRGGDEGGGWREERNPLVPIAIIAILMALVAFPVVRNLTRRLERLRAGVEAWGAGDLSARAGLAGGDEVAAVARSFDAAADAVERLLAANASLLANASHELRSPLARLRMAIDLYETDPRPALKREIVTSLAELDALVEEILVASRLEHASGPGAKATVAPVDLLALAAEEGARVDAAVSGERASVSGDPQLLRRLVRNLFQNAMRHGAPPIDARVEALAGGGGRIVVCDRGPGLPEGEAQRVFEPFYRPAGRSESAGGWGLGLSLVRQIARLHGGGARYAARANGGACFTADLPGIQIGLGSPEGNV